jgi:hypothetical protein
MRRALAAGLLALAAPALAGPVADVALPPAASVAYSFPHAYLSSISLSLTADPFYASRLLNSFSAHVTAVSALAAAPAAASYLAKEASGGGTLADAKASLGREALTPGAASAMLVANALARPDQFREVMDGLETLKPGLGRHAARILTEASGGGNRAVIAALRAAGARRPQAEGLTYGPDGRWATFFDGSVAAH